eukprot:6193616-Pleurochrysis_carterae.AAC.3
MPIGLNIWCRCSAAAERPGRLLGGAAVPNARLGLQAARITCSPMNAIATDEKKMRRSSAVFISLFVSAASKHMQQPVIVPGCKLQIMQCTINSHDYCNNSSVMSQEFLRNCQRCIRAASLLALVISLTYLDPGAQTPYERFIDIHDGQT